MFGFSTTAGSSAAALSQNNAKVALALQALAANGVAARDTQTTGLNLSAQYAYPHGVATLTGYQATQTVSAALRHPSTEGAAIDAVVTATGNAAQIDSLTFSFGDPGAVQDKARTAAVHQAVAHAQAMAAAAGRKLGPVCSLTDDTQPASPGSGQSFNGLDTLPAAADAPFRSRRGPRSSQTRSRWSTPWCDSAEEHPGRPDRGGVGSVRPAAGGSRMLGDVFGPDIFVVIVIFAVGLVIPVWAIVDAASRPSGAFAAAGSSKPMWIVLIVAGWLLTGLIGIVLAVVYLASIRPRVRAVAA